MIAAVKRNDVEAVKRIVEKFPLASKGHFLFWACQLGHLDIVKCVIDKDISQYSKNRALQTACIKNNVKLVQFLFTKGASFETDNYYALRHASFFQYYDIVFFLVSKGADRNYVHPNSKQFVDLCEKNRKKRRIRAANIIYFWWIPICYDVKRDCGKRMAEKSWKKYEKIFT